MTIKPLADRVVVKLVEAEEKTKGGLILTASAQEKPQIAEVVAVGPGGIVDGKEIAMTVKPGDKVAMGDTIGYAADSAIVESALGSHVHFSVTCYDEPMDPAEFLSLGQ